MTITQDEDWVPTHGPCVAVNGSFTSWQRRVKSRRVLMGLGQETSFFEGGMSSFCIICQNNIQMN